MIKLVIFDIDGVITDGSIIVNENGDEQKRINLKDIDALFELKRRGYKLAAITGEDTPIVRYFKNRVPWNHFLSGKKNKVEDIKEIERAEHVSKDEICYVGDGKYDVSPLSYAGLGVCPRDAIDAAKAAADLILQNNAGAGAVWELISVLDNYNTPGFYSKFNALLSDHMQIFKRMATDMLLINEIEQVADKIIGAFKNNGQLFIFGNGGSAADAQHIAAEFIGRFYKERQAYNAEALTVNTSVLTAVGNDYSFERVFVRQLEAKLNGNDIVIGITTSGKSVNVLEGLKFAKSKNAVTVMLTGDNIELPRDYIDFSINVCSGLTPRIQEAHIFIGHLLAEYVEERLYKGEAL